MDRGASVVPGDHVRGAPRYAGRQIARDRAGLTLHALHALRALRALRPGRPCRATVALELLDRLVGQLALRDRVRLDARSVDQARGGERRSAEREEERKERDRVLAQEAPKTSGHETLHFWD